VPLPRALVAICLAALVSVGLSLGISALAQQPEPQVADADLGVEWAYQPSSLAELVSETPAIVLAEVTAVRTGEPLALDSGEPERVPTQLIEMQVLQAIDGQTPQDLTLYQLGGEGMFAPGDPGYAVGERYLLFLEPRHDETGKLDGTYIPVAPDGRMEQVAGQLKPEIRGPVAERLEGASVAQAESRIEAAAP
jgi:hypothetical protein